MKKFGVIGIVCLLFLLFGCELNNQEHYVYIKVDLDNTPNAVLKSSYISVPLNQDIFLSYGTLPETNNYKVLDVYSTATDVIEITNIDVKNHKITAYTLSKGSAKIKITTDKCYSSTTLILQVN